MIFKRLYNKIDKINERIDKEVRDIKNTISDENRAYDFAIINRLVKKALINEENKLKEREVAIENEKIELQKQKNEFKYISSLKNVSLDVLKKEIDIMKDEKHNNLRKSKQEDDHHYIKARELSHTIDFIEKLI